jgi:hypothetical protein
MFRDGFIDIALISFSLLIRTRCRVSGMRRQGDDTTRSDNHHQVRVPITALGAQPQSADDIDQGQVPAGTSRGKWRQPAGCEHLCHCPTRRVRGHAGAALHDQLLLPPVQRRQRPSCSRFAHHVRSVAHVGKTACSVSTNRGGRRAGGVVSHFDRRWTTSQIKRPAPSGVIRSRPMAYDASVCA